MKSQRRHDMQTNVLADWLGQSIENLRPYGKAVLLSVLAVLVLAAIASFFMNDQAARISASWSDYFAASQDANAERLRAVATDHSGTLAALWARMNEADLELTRGLRLLYTDRGSAKSALEEAKEGYQEVIAKADNTELKNAARFGLAQTYESLGELDQAIEMFRQITSEESALFAQAQQRIETLQEPGMREFYVWFRDQKPVPRALSGAVPGSPTPGLPSNLDFLSDQPDLSFPSDFLRGTSGDSAPLTPSTGSTTPSQPPTPPVDSETQTIPPAQSQQVSPPTQPEADSGGSSTHEGAKTGEPEAADNSDGKSP